MPLKAILTTLSSSSPFFFQYSVPALEGLLESGGNKKIVFFLFVFSGKNFFWGPDGCGLWKFWAKYIFRFYDLTINKGDLSYRRRTEGVYVMKTKCSTSLLKIDAKNEKKK